MRRLFLVLFISLFTAISVFAADNVLQSVQIEPYGDTFNIVLVADSTVSFKKTVQAPNRIMLSLKGIRASKTLSTVYKNVSNVDNIIVEPYGVDGLNIMFQADNASNATVSFDSLVSSVKVDKQANPKKEILLNAPMNTYTPIYKQDSDEKPSVLSNIDLKGVLVYVKSMFSGTRTTTLLTFGLFGVIFLLGAKMIRGKDQEIKVGLTQGLRDNRDILNTKEVPNMTGGYRVTPNKPYTSMNYGVKAYQNSTKSPYLQMHTKPVSRMDNMSSIPSRNLMADSVAPRTVSQPVQNRIRPQAASATMSKPKIQPKRVDSMKFLESMSEIYEKSGRPDLANGIRTKLTKIGG